MCAASASSVAESASCIPRSAAPCHHHRSGKPVIEMAAMPRCVVLVCKESPSALSIPTIRLMDRRLPMVKPMRKITLIPGFPGRLVLIPFESPAIVGSSSCPDAVGSAGGFSGTRQTRHGCRPNRTPAAGRRDRRQPIGPPQPFPSPRRARQAKPSASPGCGLPLVQPPRRFRCAHGTAAVASRLKLRLAFRVGTAEAGGVARRLAVVEGRVFFHLPSPRRGPKFTSGCGESISEPCGTDLAHNATVPADARGGASPRERNRLP